LKELNQSHKMLCLDFWLAEEQIYMFALVAKSITF